MEVMKNHKFFDDDVQKVLYDGHENNREIVLEEEHDNFILINKEDVIALAKEFNLIVFEEKSKL